ncbi:hypothetical protein Dimus_019709 [Dionaea muscipula]
MAVNRLWICSPAVVKLTLALIALCIAGYIVGPPLYWHLMEGLATVTRSSSSSSFSAICPTCVCDCSSQPLLTIPEGLSNTSFAGCAKHEPGVSEDTEKRYAELFSEELRLREAEAAENQRRADVALLESKKITSQYQKEAEKCNSGMETCEEAREKAEAALVAQKKLTALWEVRARKRGWNDGVARNRGQSQGSVQSS